MYSIVKSIKLYIKIIVTISVFATLPIDTAKAQSDRYIIGTPQVIDGDSIIVSGQKIRLWGIDAFEIDQTCQDFKCGEASANYLRKIIADANAKGYSETVCTKRDVDRYGRIVAICSLAGYDIGEQMVKSGFALAFRKYSYDYVEAEESAKAKNLGAWNYEFQDPSEFRKSKQNNHTNINAINSKDVDGNEALAFSKASEIFKKYPDRNDVVIGVSDEDGEVFERYRYKNQNGRPVNYYTVAPIIIAPPIPKTSRIPSSNNSDAIQNGCNIKGNINSKGERIYHIPGDPSYNKTIPEKLFCSIQEAKDDGFRAPYSYQKPKPNPAPYYERKSSGKPAGVSFVCRDGSFSFAAHRQGACSHHGGIAY